MRNELMEKLAEAEKDYAAKSAAYRAAIGEKVKAETVVRETCDAAFEAGGICNALRKAVASLPAPSLEVVK